IVLHPSFKLTYFSRLNWPEDWIREAKNVTRNAWVSRYKPASSEPAPMVSGSSVHWYYAPLHHY
ncbi:hypothetical protein BDP27DRAFT_1239371, partial [Rhodocollybia butyracea]